MSSDFFITLPPISFQMIALLGMDMLLAATCAGTYRSEVEIVSSFNPMHVVSLKQLDLFGPAQVPGGSFQDLAAEHERTEQVLPRELFGVS